MRGGPGARTSRYVDVSAFNVTNPANVAVMKARGTTPEGSAPSGVPAGTAPPDGAGAAERDQAPVPGPAGVQVEWLALPDGTVRRVVTVGSELLPPDAAARAVAPKCACGEPRRIRAQSCGAAECVERLWASMKS